MQVFGSKSGSKISICGDLKRIRRVKVGYFYKNTDLVYNPLMATPFTEKSYEKNWKNLQTKIYLALFSDFWYLVPKRSNAIFFRVTSKKSYCSLICLSDGESCSIKIPEKNPKKMVVEMENRQKSVVIEKPSHSQP